MRFSSFIDYQEGRVKAGVSPLSQPYLLGDEMHQFFFFNQAGLPRAQEVFSVVPAMRAMVERHMLNPMSGHGRLRPFRGTNLNLHKSSQKKKVMMAKYAPSRIVKASEADAVAVD